MCACQVIFEALRLQSSLKLCDSLGLYPCPGGQAPLSMGFPRQEYWNALPFPSPGDLLDPGIKPSLLHWQAASLPLSYQGSPFLRLYLHIFPIYFPHALQTQLAHIISNS